MKETPQLDILIEDYSRRISNIENLIKNRQQQAINENRKPERDPNILRLVTKLNDFRNFVAELNRARFNNLNSNECVDAKVNMYELMSRIKNTMYAYNVTDEFTPLIGTFDKPSGLPKIQFKFKKYGKNYKLILKETQ